MKSNIKHHAISAIGVGVLFGAIEIVQPSESASLDFTSFIRPIIFAIIIWLFMVPASAITNDIFEKYTSKPFHPPLFIRLIIACMIGSFPLSFFIPWIANSFNLGGTLQDISWMSISLHDHYIITRYLKFAGVISILWILVNYRWYSSQDGLSEIVKPPITTEATASNPSIETDVSRSEVENQKPNFLNLSKKPLGTEVWLLSAEQHYVRILTNTGDDLILYRFSDAVRDMSQSNEEGLQVHRSHWVHINAIASITNHNRSYLIHLKNGDEIPVARSSKNLIEHAGWIQRFAT